MVVFFFRISLLWMAVAVVAAAPDSNTADYCLPFKYTLQVSPTETLESAVAQVHQQGSEYVNQSLQVSPTEAYVVNWTSVSYAMAASSSSSSSNSNETRLATSYCQQGKKPLENCGLVSAIMCVTAPSDLEPRLVQTLSYSKIQMFVRDNTDDLVYHGPIQVKTQFLLDLKGAKRYMSNREQQALLNVLADVWTYVLPEFKNPVLTLVLEQAVRIPKADPLQPPQRRRRRRNLRQQHPIEPRYPQHGSSSSRRNNNHRLLQTSNLGSLASSAAGTTVGGTTTSNSAVGSTPSGSAGSSTVGDVSGGDLAGSLGNLTGGGGGGDDTNNNIPDAILDNAIPPNFPVNPDQIPVNTIEIVVAAECEGQAVCTQDNLEEEIRNQAGNYVGDDGSILLDQLQNDAEANAGKYYNDIFDIVLDHVGLNADMSEVTLDINITAILENAKNKIPPLESQRQSSEQAAAPSWIWILIFGCIAVLVWGALITWQLVRYRNRKNQMQQIYDTFHNRGCINSSANNNKNNKEDEEYRLKHKDESIVIQAKNTLDTLPSQDDDEEEEEKNADDEDMMYDEQLEQPIPQRKASQKYLFPKGTAVRASSSSLSIPNGAAVGGAAALPLVDEDDHESEAAASETSSLSSGLVHHPSDPYNITTDEEDDDDNNNDEPLPMVEGDSQLVYSNNELSLSISQVNDMLPEHELSLSVQQVNEMLRLPIE